MRVGSDTPHLLRGYELMVGHARPRPSLGAALQIYAGPDAATTTEDAEAKAARTHEAADGAVLLVGARGLLRTNALGLFVGHAVQQGGKGESHGGYSAACG